MRQMTVLRGLENFKAEVAGFVKKASLYKTFNKKPPTLILHLDSKQGRTTATQYLVDNFAESGLYDFSYAREELLELDFDGSFSNVTGNIDLLEENSDFSNDYSNVCAVTGLDKLSKHMGESQVELFLEKVVRTVSKSGYLVVFASVQPKAQEIELLEKVKSELSGFIELNATPYTTWDYAQALSDYLAALGAMVAVVGEAKDMPELEVEGITMKRVIEIAEEYLMEAEMVDGTPIVTIEAIKEESEVKENGKK